MRQQGESHLINITMSSRVVVQLCSSWRQITKRHSVTVTWGWPWSLARLKTCLLSLLILFHSVISHRELHRPKCPAAHRENSKNTKTKGPSFSYRPILLLQQNSEQIYFQWTTLWWNNESVQRLHRDHNTARTTIIIDFYAVFFWSTSSLIGSYH